MELITSRKNQYIRYFRRLGRERDFRRERGEFLGDGEKLFEEALKNGAEIGAVLLRQGREAPALPGVPVLAASDDVFDYASPLVNSPGPLFTVLLRPAREERAPNRVIVLENVQDPGNVGTVLRSAAALGCGMVVLTGECADPYNPKTVRASMGAIFRQRLLELPLTALPERLSEWKLPLYGAALSERAADVRDTALTHAAVAVGNEGSGLTRELLNLCDREIIIPMSPGSESFNAAVAASILLWEMARCEGER